MTTMLTGIQRPGHATVTLSTYVGSVAALVRARAALLNVTGKQLAEAMGVTQMNVSRRLRGQVPFDVLELAAVAALLGCDVADLLPSAPDDIDPVRELRRRVGVDAGDTSNV